MLADSDSTPTATRPSVAGAPAGPTRAVALAASRPNPLSARELYQLTLFKWRYALEAYGFEPREVRDLMFLKWLHTSRRVQP